MEKLNISVKQLVPTILGTLLFLLGLAILPGGGAMSIIASIIAILIGACYVLIGLFESFVEQKKLGGLAKTLLIAGLPFYFLVMDVFTLIDGTAYFKLIGWIMIVIKMLSELGILVFAIVLLFKTNDKLIKFKNYSLLVFLCMLIVGCIFGYSGATLTLTGTSLLEYAFIACFAFLAFSALDDNYEPKDSGKQDNSESPEQPEQTEQTEQSEQTKQTEESEQTE